MVKNIRRTSKNKYIAILCVLLLSCFAISGLVLAAPGDPNPEIDVQGNSISIANGDETPSEADGRVFGNVDITYGAVERTFTIENTGTATLNITGNILVYRTQGATPHFTVTQPSATSLAAGESTTFTVRFDPASVGEKDAFIEIPNNDSDENPYIFVIAGTGVDLRHDASLSGLLVDGTTVSGFEPDTTTYNVELPAGTTIVPTVTYTLNDSAATDLLTDADGLPGATTVVVTAEDRVTTVTYTINFTVAEPPPGPDASLSDLLVDGTTVDGFNPDTLSYDVELPYGTTAVPTVTCETTNPDADAIVTDAAALPGTATVVVTAADGVTTATYTIDFTVAESEPDLDGDGDLDVVTDRAKVTDKDEATVYAYVEVDEDDWDDDIYDIYKYGFFYGTDKGDVEDVADLSDFSDFDSLDVDFEGADDEDYKDRDEEFRFSADLRNLEDKEDYYFRAFIEYEDTDDGLIYYSLGKVKHFDLGDYRKSSAGSSISRPVVIPQPEPLTPSVFTIGSPTYLLNGSYQAMDAAPYIKNSRTYLPIRYVGYAMGLTDADIQWDEAAQMVTLTKGTTVVSLVIGNPVMFKNGTPVTMDVVPEITNDRTCLPIAWVAQAFGHTAVWDPILQTVTIR